MVGLAARAPAAVAAAATPRAAGPTTTAPPAPVSKAWILVDVDTGRVIDAGNDRTPLPPASLTKVITALTAASLSPDTPVPISDRAAAAPADKLLLKAGQVWTADELQRALLISSANDAAIALAEKVGGTLEGFQPIFAQTALGLGMADHPVLMDPAGLDGPDGVDGGNLVSTRDLAMAGRALLAVPWLAAIVATPVYYFDGPDKVRHRLTNHNKLFLTTYAGAIGMKTGYTKRAGGCLMAAARVGGRTMLAVVLNSTNPTLAVKKLLDEGFATPVAAEPTADALPAVVQASDALPVRTGADLPTAASSASLSPPGPALGPTAVLAPPSSTAASWRVLTAAGTLALVLCLGLIAASARRRRRDLGPNLWAQR